MFFSICCSSGQSLSGSILRCRDVSSLNLVHLSQQPQPNTKSAWIVLMNPNGMFMEQMRVNAKQFVTSLGCNALIFDYRGVGESEGSVSTARDLVQDGVCALEFLQTELGVAPEHTMVFGHSLGSAVAVNAICEISRRRRRYRGLSGLKSNYHKQRLESSSSSSSATRSSNYTVVLDRGFSSLGDVGTAYTTNSAVFGWVTATAFVQASFQVLATTLENAKLLPQKKFSFSRRLCGALVRLVRHE